MLDESQSGIREMVDYNSYDSIFFVQALVPVLFLSYSKIMVDHFKQ